MRLPRVMIDVSKIVHNFQTINHKCLSAGVSMTGVVKGLAGNLKVVEPLVAAGLNELGDSRIENLRRFSSLTNVRKVLLRLPGISKLDETVRFADVSLNSEAETLGRIDQLTEYHEVLLMIDLGDRREGVLESEIARLGRFCQRLKNVKVIGVGANFSCFAGVKPTPDKLGDLVAVAGFLKEEFGLPIRFISGGNSSSLPMLYSGSLPPGINHLRIGEGILLGRETLTGGILPDLFGDAFTVEAEVIQAQWKPALPDGEIGRDAFGRQPHIPEAPDGYRLLINLGQQDTSLTGLTPLDPGIRVLGGSSDYLVLASQERFKVGSIIRFLPDYWGLLALMTSPYVDKYYY